MPTRPDDLSARTRIPAPADDLCLTFANTRFWRGSPEPTEELRGIGDLLAWAGSAGGLPARALARFRAAWTADPAADAVLAEAIALREAMARLFAAIADGRECAPDDLTGLNAALAVAPCRDSIGLTETPSGWDVALRAPSVPALLAPVLWSAGDLLLGPRAARVRQCANPACLWLFLDDSKSGNRRWCSMSSCGNRAKAHRHYLRRKATANGPDGVVRKAAG